jgi:serine/threonine-protein kinase RsbW
VQKASGDYITRVDAPALRLRLVPAKGCWWLDQREGLCYPLQSLDRAAASGARRMSSPQPDIVRLEFCSAFDMLDFVQVVGDYLCRRVGFDEDSMHWVSVAIRECVINAIKHGNHNDQRKLVHVEFISSSDPETGGLVVAVRDEGEGFEPGEVADPLAPENMLKSSGRGIFLIRSFMDDMQLRRVPEGGMEVRMVKKLAKAAL